MGKQNNRFKRKFAIDGDTLQTCDTLCKKVDYDKKPCMAGQQPPKPIIQKGYGGRTYTYTPYWSPSIDKDQCPFKDQLDKPKKYIVSETVDDHWVCNCPKGIFGKVNGNSVCNHVKEVKKNPDKYEIPIEITGKAVDVMNAI